MEIRSLFKKIFGNKTQTENYTEMRLMSGYEAMFTNVGHNVYDSKVVREVIDRIATNCAKLVPKHLQKGRHIYGDINYLLQVFIF